MKLISLNLLLFLMILNLYANATVLSCNLWNKYHKHIAVIGERHVDVAAQTDEWAITDRGHNELFQRYLDRWSESYQKIAVLIESSPERTQKSIKIIDQYRKKKTDPGYIGMHLSLPIFAHNTTYSYGSIHFIETNLRTLSILAPIDFVLNIGDLINRNIQYNALDYRGKHHPESFLQEAKKVLEDKNLRNLLYKLCNSTKIEDYLDSLNDVIEKYKKKEIALCNKLSELRSKLLMMINQNEWQKNDLIITCFSNLILQERADYLFDICFSTFQEASSTIADIGAKSTLHEAIKSYDFILLFGGEQHAQTINNYLKELGFENQSTISKKAIPKSSAQEQSLTLEELDKSLQLFTEIMHQKPLIMEEKKTICSYCVREEPIKNVYKQCSRCKKMRYCSPECQKKDWPNHKKICKPLNT